MKASKNISIDSKFKENFKSCVYMLKCYDNEEALQKKTDDYLLYTGMAKDPIKNLEAHFKQKERYTKRFRGNLEVGYMELYDDLKKAQERREQIRKLRREEKSTLLAKKIVTSCDKCGSRMEKSFLIDHDGTKHTILQCKCCNFWIESPVKF
ncbi:MAG: GIY-YIG nuclease family protein [Candidatus Lokiarchaeota archaeon]